MQHLIWIALAALEDFAENLKNGFRADHHWVLLIKKKKKRTKYVIDANICFFGCHLLRTTAAVESSNELLQIFKKWISPQICVVVRPAAIRWRCDVMLWSL